ncbi:DUF4352 domain-containing protein [Streptacidiphilus griseoplanus]|uniref:DUF4352 domain-containing protein n=1 Tax=Peterkaempfera griseoplana TaxID=66896 RepID=UPI0006E1516E|nr:DUF4352 domain-containing protein [Peterkaempfera griseoplana]
MSRSIRTAAVLLSAALVAAGATACSSTGSSVATAPKAGAATGGDAASSSGQKSRQPKKKTDAKVGDTISLKGMDTKADVTVLKVVDHAKGADEFTTPESGKRFVAVQFRIRNTGSKAYNDSPSNGAKVLDTEGQGFDASFSDTTAGPSFPGDVTIAPGGTAKGFITFEVPKGAKLDKVQFGLDSGFADQTGQWNVR